MTARLSLTYGTTSVSSATAPMPIQYQPRRRALRAADVTGDLPPAVRWRWRRRERSAWLG